MATQSPTNEFDPASLGATPIAGSSPAPSNASGSAGDGGFDPSSIGAQPVSVAPQDNSILGRVLGGAKFVANAVLAPAENAGAHLGELAAGGTADLAEAFGRNDIAQHIRQNLAKPQTNLTGGDVPTLQTGMRLAPQLLGDAASTALMAYVPDSAGVLKMALLGMGAGVSNTLASGSLDINELASNAKKGLVYGGVLGLLGKAAGVISSTEKLASGVDPAMENEISQTRPVTLAKYINTAKDSATDFHAPTVSDTLESDLRNGVGILQKKVLPSLYKARDAALHDTGASPLIFQGAEDAPAAVGSEAVNSLKDDINTAMQRMTGHQFSEYASGEASGLQIKNYPQGPSTAGLGVEGGNVEPLPGRVVEMSAADRGKLDLLHRQLASLAEHPTVQTASDVLKNLDSKIDWERPAMGDGSTPVDGLLRYARGSINRTIAPAAPELAAVNQQLGHLAGVEQTLAQGAGANLQHLDLLARRTLYDGQSGNAQSALDGLYDAVKGHLPAGEESYTTKAIIARFAKDNFGGKTAQTGFAQGMSTGDIGGLASGFKSRVVGAGLRAAKRVLSPEPEQYAMSIAKGEPYSFVPLAHHIDEFLDSKSSSGIVNVFKSELKNIGVSSAHVGDAAKTIVKMMFFNQLTRPQATPPDYQSLPSYAQPTRSLSQ